MIMSRGLIDPNKKKKIKKALEKGDTSAIKKRKKVEHSETKAMLEEVQKLINKGREVNEADEIKNSRKQRLSKKLLKKIKPLTENISVGAGIGSGVLINPETDPARNRQRYLPKESDNSEGHPVEIISKGEQKNVVSLEELARSLDELELIRKIDELLVLYKKKDQEYGERARLKCKQIESELVDAAQELVKIKELKNEYALEREHRTLYVFLGRRGLFSGIDFQEKKEG